MRRRWRDPRPQLTAWKMEVKNISNKEGIGLCCCTPILCWFKTLSRGREYMWVVLGIDGKIGLDFSPLKVVLTDGRLILEHVT